MRQKSMGLKEGAEAAVRDIRRRTRKQYSAEDKIRIVLSGLRGEDSIKRLPLAHLHKAGRATLDQLQSFATGEGIFMFATRPSVFGYSTTERAQDQVELLKPVVYTGNSIRLTRG